MEVKLYANISDNIVASKSITLLNTITVDLWENTTPLDAEMLVSSFTGIESVNYAYFNNRYWFVTPVKTQGNRYILQCHVDLVKTYSSAIKSADVVATRSNFRNDNIKDPMVLEIPKQTIQYRKLSAEITGSSYIMIVGG